MSGLNLLLVPVPASRVFLRILRFSSQQFQISGRFFPNLVKITKHYGDFIFSQQKAPRLKGDPFVLVFLCFDYPADR